VRGLIFDGLRRMETCCADMITTCVEIYFFFERKCVEIIPELNEKNSKSHIYIYQHLLFIPMHVNKNISSGVWFHAQIVKSKK
jgi:hypothetical protein